jgi:hydroxymethylbilane synthase
MPAVLVDGLAIAAVLPRADPHDAVVLPASRQEPTSTVGELVTALGQAPSIGTGSVRRVAQLRRLFPGARFVPIRGNLETRLRKLDSGEHDALVLAAAGLRRLGFPGRISFTLPATACVPAPGQGIVAVEIREDDETIRRVVAPIDDPAAGAALRAERALVEALGGGCQTPIGAVATLLEGEMIEIVAVVVTVDGRRALRTRASGRLADAAAVGVRAARQLLDEGAGDILAEARQVHAIVEGIQP